jgi:hypothetical protein
MPTNLPDRRKQEVQVSEDLPLDGMIAVLMVGKLASMRNINISANMAVLPIEAPFHASP